MHCCTAHAADPPIGRIRHSPGQRLERHTHGTAHAAIVLSGSFREAGDLGRRDLQAGDVVLREPLEPHLNLVATSGAVVLVLPRDHWTRSAFARVGDPDQLARLAERDLVEALHCLEEQLRLLGPVKSGWPDLLASRLRRGWTGSLAEWADHVGCRPETVSREFKKAYGCSPREYRVSIRSRAALTRIRTSKDPFAAIAADLGFADQAHMSRAIGDLTGRPPSAFRAR